VGARSGRDAGQQPAAALGFRARHDDDDLALGADGDRVHGLREARAEERGDALALEEAAHDHRLGLGAAILLQRLPWLRSAVYPLLVASQSIPVVAIAPLLVIYLGFGLSPKALIVALVCFFPITANALDGFASAPAELRRTMRTLNATPGAIFWRVELPWASPRVFTGARIAASYAAVAALFAEYAGGSGGLADSMHDQLDTQLVGAAILLLALLALALFGLVTLLERAMIPWAHEG
jgi:putative hydroxymethylpyrimidine transport system permease protein